MRFYRVMGFVNGTSRLIIRDFNNEAAALDWLDAMEGSVTIQSQEWVTVPEPIY